MIEVIIPTIKNAGKATGTIETPKQALAFLIIILFGLIVFAITNNQKKE